MNQHLIHYSAHSDHTYTHIYTHIHTYTHKALIPFAIEVLNWFDARERYSSSPGLIW